MIISASIDLAKLDKSKIVEGKNGGKYYNVTLFVGDEKDKYGIDVSVSDKQEKEEIAAKAPKKYLGNGRVIWQGASKQDRKDPAYSSKPQSKTDDLPF